MFAPSLSNFTFATDLASKITVYLKTCDENWPSERDIFVDYCISMECKMQDIGRGDPTIIGYSREGNTRGVFIAVGIPRFQINSIFPSRFGVTRSHNQQSMKQWTDEERQRTKSDPEIHGNHQ